MYRILLAWCLAGLGGRTVIGATVAPGTLPSSLTMLIFLAIAIFSPTGFGFCAKACCCCCCCCSECCCCSPPFGPSVSMAMFSFSVDDETR
uniref:Putative secreted peptide n=1 Tax=Anopheles braziliensis TaxID=58242 RepID=A0A2M3ZPP3_9DIPT